MVVANVGRIREHQVIERLWRLFCEVTFDDSQALPCPQFARGIRKERIDLDADGALNLFRREDL